MLIIEAHHCSNTHKTSSNILLSRSLPYEEETTGGEIMSVDFDATDQLLITYSAIVKYSRKNVHTIGQLMSYL